MPQAAAIQKTILANFMRTSVVILCAQCIVRHSGLGAGDSVVEWPYALASRAGQPRRLSLHGQTGDGRMRPSLHNQTNQWSVPTQDYSPPTIRPSMRMVGAATEPRNSRSLAISEMLKNKSFRFPATVISSTGYVSSPFEIQRPDAPRE